MDLELQERASKQRRDGKVRYGTVRSLLTHDPQTDQSDRVSSDCLNKRRRRRRRLGWRDASNHHSTGTKTPGHNTLDPPPFFNDEKRRRRGIVRINEKYEN